MMIPGRFDEFARMAARGLSRRALLKAVAAGFVASGLTRVGLTRTAESRVAGQQDTVFSTSSVPICTTAQDDTWSFARDFAHGVIGRDLIGHRIFSYPAYKTGGVGGDIIGGFAGRNWYPLAPEKKTLCGRLHHFNFYDAWSSGDEADWNNFIIPGERFAYLINDARPFAGGDIHDCDGRNNCMEAEVTPDDHLYEFRYFRKSTGSSPLEGQDLCTYGPWVREEIHGNRPEIHPSELYWWRVRVDRGPFHLLVVQDDSNRFYKRDQYDVPRGETRWHPWSVAPRYAEFRVNFQVDPRTTDPWTFGLTQSQSSREVITRNDASARSDSDDGRQHTLRYNGRALLHVVERQAADDDVGVQFVGVCRNATSTRVRGYIQIRTKVGVNDRGREGFSYLVLQKDETEESVAPSELVPTAPNTAAPMIIVGALPETLRRETVDGREQLVGDIQVRLEPGESFSPEDTTVARVVVAGSLRGAEEAAGPGIELAFVPGTTGAEESVAPPTASPAAGDLATPVPLSPVTGTVVALPVSLSAPVEFTMESGLVVPVTAPGVFLAARIAVETVGSSTADEAAWATLAKAVDASNLRATPSVQPQRVDAWQLTATPAYAPWRIDELALGDETPFTEALNMLLQYGDAETDDGFDQDRFRELFGTEAPFAVEWSFEATNLADNAPVDVHIGSGGTEGDIRIVLQPAPIGRTNHSIPDARLNVTFPMQPAGAVFQLVATARMTDVFGGTSEVQRVLWSHALSGEDEQSLVESTLGVVAALSGLPADVVLEGSKMEDAPSDEETVAFDDRDSDPQTRRLQSVRLFAIGAAADRLITVDELRALVRGAQVGESSE
jgi:hypothetical protein